MAGTASSGMRRAPWAVQCAVCTMLAGWLPRQGWVSRVFGRSTLCFCPSFPPRDGMAGTGSELAWQGRASSGFITGWPWQQIFQCLSIGIGIPRLGSISSRKVKSWLCSALLTSELPLHLPPSSDVIHPSNLELPPVSPCQLPRRNPAPQHPNQTLRWGPNFFSGLNCTASQFAAPRIKQDWIRRERATPPRGNGLGHRGNGRPTGSTAGQWKSASPRGGGGGRAGWGTGALSVMLGGWWGGPERAGLDFSLRSEPRPSSTMPVSLSRRWRLLVSVHVFFLWASRLLAHFLMASPLPANITRSSIHLASPLRSDLTD